MGNLLKEQAEKYQPLFELMMDEHGLILTVGEMNEIIEASKQVISAYDGK